MEVRFLSPKEKNLGAFRVKRFLPSSEQQMVGPWIFFDHFGPAQLEPGNGLDVRPHPHINLATVTYLFDGEIMHRDSLGCEQPIRPGEINLMVAGKGIVHSERESEAARQKKRMLNGLQLWCALPEEAEECEPTFNHYDTEEIPDTQIDNARIKVLIGSAYGVTSPVKTHSDMLYAIAAVDKGASLQLPEAPELALYLMSGHLESSNLDLSEGNMVVLPVDQRKPLIATEPSHLALIGGAPLGHRHIEWNFVSSRKERIAQAKEQWKSRSFQTVPGDDVEFIPLPDK